MKKTLSKNIFLSVIKTISSMIFPLITFPYATRVLMPSGIGEYNYSNSIISYFVLLSGLGIGAYAGREGAKRREDRREFERFANEIFSLNVITTIVTYALFLGCIIGIQRFYEHRVSLAIYSLSIVSSTIGVEWIFNIYEDYFYITLRSLAIQVVSVICLFVFVKDTGDVYWYIGISVFVNLLANILNFICARKYFHVRLILSKEIFTHFKPVLLLFFTTLSTVIYVNSDMTMLGWMCGTEQVGYYTVACKMYNVVKSALSAVIAAFTTRLAYLYSREFEKYRGLFRYGVDLLLTISIPLAIGSFLFSEDIIIVLSDRDYLIAENSMKILFVSIIFATLGHLYSSSGLLLMGKEKVMLISTSVGALINVILNWLLIPVYGCLGAAFSTLVTEMVVFSILFVNYQGEGTKAINSVHLVKCVLSATSFWVIKKIGYILGFTDIGAQIVLIVVCIVVYGIILFFMNDYLIVDMLRKVKRKIARGT